MERRPLASRQTGWARFLAKRLAEGGMTPNQISVGGALLAVAGCLVWASGLHDAWALMLVAICIQLRLLCNLMDGMVAIEGKKATPTGVIFNEVPDRLADVLFLVPLGYAIGFPWAGWLLGVLAVCTAYVRLFGASLGLGDDFRGPCAKPHRMAILTLTCVLGALELGVFHHFYVGYVGALILIVGTGWTIVRRLKHIVAQLESQHAAKS